jgi:TldD protein
MHLCRNAWLAAAMAVVAAACGSRQADTAAPGVDRDAPDDALPNEPVVIDLERVEPDRDHDPSARSPLLDVMGDENRRWMAALAEREDEPAYYISYQLVEQRRISLEAEGSSLLVDEDETARALDVEVRVGSPELDNRHPLADDRMEAFNRLPRIGRAPLQDDPAAMRRELWLETDRRYREAALQLRNVRTQRSILAAEERSPDFSHEEPETFIQQVAELEIDRDDWRERIRACSARARRGVATRATCRADFHVTTMYFVSSEGSELQHSATTARVSVSVGVKADDGMSLSRSADRYAASATELASDEAIEEMIDKVAAELQELHGAPVVDPYVGPAILDGRAAAVFMHEVFGHRIEAHRQEHRVSGQTFADKVGDRIMPEWLSIYDDPTVARLNGQFLSGHYRYDDEGVRAQRAELVQDGVLRGFVQGRQPLAGFPRSNGHGRKEPGHVAVSRQGNLIVEAARSVGRDELEARLLREIARQGKPYGMVFTEIAGGMTNTTRLGPQSFKVHPVMAYRLYPDGRRELVRGVDIVGTPLSALASIRAAGRPVETFNGMCGAESGWVPVSASSPSLLLESLEVERSFTPAHRPPVLSPPQ